jgi:hypothetical protein
MECIQQKYSSIQPSVLIASFLSSITVMLFFLTLALFLIQDYLVSKFCPSVLESIGLRVPAQYIGDFALFSICSSCKICPSPGYASAAGCF